MDEPTDFPKSDGFKPEFDTNHNSQLELEHLDTQVGGHSSKNEKYSNTNLGIYDLKNGLVMKGLLPPPRGLRELHFYESVFDQSCTDEDLLNLRQFVPGFYGSLQQNGAMMIKLTNLTAPYKSPCIMDLKVGAITYDPEATAEKIKIEDEKFPPQKQLGYKISGMLLQNGKEKHCLEKNLLRKLTEETMVHHGLGMFFSIIKERDRRQVIHRLIQRLLKLETWFSKQKKYFFIASSLLFVYEGHNGNDLPKVSADCMRVVDDRVISDINTQVNSYASNSMNAQQSLDKHMDCYDMNNDSKILKGNNDEKLFKSERLSEQRNNDSFKVSSDSDNDSVPNCSVHLIDFGHVFSHKDIDENFLFGLRNLIVGLKQLCVS